ncbi:MAG: hydroxymethylbilane synthase, partial [Oceanicaulis sp.]
MTNPLPIATRTSPLATTQTKDVQARLAAATGRTAEIDFPILGLQTTGDRITDRALLAAGGKGLFTKELDAALLSGQARFAVHSMKDVPTRLPEGLEIAAILEREDPRDVLITNSDIARVDDLPEGAVLGTASIRRQAQALRRRPDLKIVLLRGNVDTRLEKIRSGEIDATFLARAGLRRLGRAEAGRDPVCDSEMIPAPA